MLINIFRNFLFTCNYYELMAFIISALSISCIVMKG